MQNKAIFKETQTFADFLYELQTRLGYDPEAQVANGNGSSLPINIAFLRNELRLSNFLSTESLASICHGEMEPPGWLVLHVRNYLERYDPKLLPVFEESTKEVDCKSPLAKLLRGKITKASALFKEARSLNIYPSLLVALMNDSIIPSPTLLDSIATRAKIDKKELDSIKADVSLRAQSLYDFKPAEAMTQRLLGQCTKTSTIPEIMASLIYKGFTVR